MAAFVAEKPETFAAPLRSLAMADRVQTMQTQEMDMKPASFFSVQPPQAHEGVGRALRSAYIDKGNDLPEDMARLLEQLDRL
ncbi:MAG TPA: hypothetical protein VF509_11145 [Sphingobium sp.]